jgi:hypothetical protein
MKMFRLADMTVLPAENAAACANRHFFYSSLVKIKSIVLFFGLLVSVSVQAQSNVTDTAYQRVITERTAKIINTLNIKDAALYTNVHQQLITQYIKLNTIQDESKAAITAIKAQAPDKEAQQAVVKKEEERKTALLKQLHQEFIAQLKVQLNESQVEQIKDGMTYRVLPVTWTAYLDMLPKLTSEQKNTMYAWLVEARELAMDEGSSDKKHAVFGKYKGKINNYLSAQGYDMKKEGEDWAKRIQAAKEAKQNQH